MYLNHLSVLHLGAWPHALPGPHDFIDQQQLLGQGGSDVEPLLLGAVVVVDLFLYGGNSAQGLQVQPHCHLALVVFVLQTDYGFLDVVSAVLGQGLSSGKNTLGMTRRDSAKA
jgi:hypothetical protein